jgi:hypothetical protein
MSEKGDCFTFTENPNMTELLVVDCTGRGETKPASFDTSRWIIPAPDKHFPVTNTVCVRNNTTHNIVFEQNPSSSLDVVVLPGETVIISTNLTAGVETPYSRGGACACCCVAPSSRVHTSRGIQPISQMVAGDTVYTESNDQVKVLFVARFAVPSKQFIRIQKDSLGTDKPARDLLIREGHPLVVDGKEIACQDLVNGTSIDQVELDTPLEVYTLCTKQRVAVMIEGLAVLTYAKNDFFKYAVDNQIPYTAL